MSKALFPLCIKILYSLKGIKNNSAGLLSLYTLDLRVNLVSGSHYILISAPSC